jgi:hypothetical protein
VSRRLNTQRLSCGHRRNLQPDGTLWPRSAGSIYPGRWSRQGWRRYGTPATRTRCWFFAAKPFLNVLLSFAQFEREVIGERIRDKIAPSKRKGCGWAACRRSGIGHRQAHHPRQRGGNRALHFSPLCRTRLGPAVEGRAGRPPHPQQVADERLGPPARQQAIRARRTLFDAAKPGLSRRDRPQGAIPSW